MVKFSLNKKQQNKAEELGGAENNWSDYYIKQDLGYPDKGDHRLRSIANSPQHERYFRRLEREYS